MFYVCVASDDGLVVPAHLHGIYVYSEVIGFECKHAIVKPISEIPPVNEDVYEVIVYASQETINDIIGFDLKCVPGRLYPIDNIMMRDIAVQYFIMYQFIFAVFVRCCQYISLKEVMFKRVRNLARTPWRLCLTTKNMVCSGWCTAKARTIPIAEAFWRTRLV